MKNNFIRLIITLFSFNGISQIDRIENSLYPSSSIPDTLYVINDLIHTDNELFVIQSLQGILAKTKPILFRERGSGSSIWINDLVENYGIYRSNIYDTNLVQLLTDFKSYFNGYILCNSFDESSNVAISLAGINSAVTIPSELESVAISAGLNLNIDVRNKNYSWVLDTYGNELSFDIIAYQKEEKGHFLSDYSIFSNAFHFYGDIHGEITEKAFGRMNKNSVLFGWGDDEYQTIRKSSEFGIGVHPGDWAFNLSTLTNFNAETSQKEPINRDTVTIPNTHTVCFLMSDGDNIQWMLNLFADDQRWFGSTNRGLMPIGWTIPPALCELAPTVMHKLYDMAENTENGRDYFIAGPSGNTYNFPDFFVDNMGQCTIMDSYLEKSNLNIVNILGNDDNPRILSEYTALENVDGVFYYDYGNYSKGEGKIHCDSWKPIIQSRFNLWGGFETGESMATKLNNLPRTPENQNGYSLIAVHAWSNSVDSLLFVKSQLDNDIRVVAPDDFVYLIKRNLCKNQPSQNTYPNPSSGEIHIQLSTPFTLQTVIVYDLLGREIAVPFEYNESQNSTYIDLFLNEELKGIFNILVIGEENQFCEKIFKY